MYHCDNAVAEDTYKVIKTKFVNNKRFETLEQLGYELVDYLERYFSSVKNYPQLLGSGYKKYNIHSSLDIKYY